MLSFVVLTFDEGAVLHGGFAIGLRHAEEPAVIYFEEVEFVGAESDEHFGNPNERLAFVECH